MTNENGFRLPNKEGMFDSYIGKYILIYSGSFRTGGKLVRIIDESYAVLNPFQGAKYDAKTGLNKQMIEGDAMVFLSGASIEPTTKEDLENFCLYENEKKKQEEKDTKDAKDAKVNEKKHLIL